MQNLLLTTIMLLLSLITNAQEIDGEWTFEKINYCVYDIYLDGTSKDKKKFNKGYIKKIKSRMADDDDKNFWIDLTKGNEEANYFTGQMQKFDLIFKGDKLFFKLYNVDNEMEDAEAQINFNGEILKLYNSKPLHAISAFKVLLETNNLTLTEVDGKAKSSN